MSSFSEEERFAMLPIFILVDVSKSMRSAIEAVNTSLPILKEELENYPTAAEIARVAVLTFSDYANTALPLSDLKFAEMPTLSIKGNTNFAEAFRYSRQVIKEEICKFGKGIPFHTPIVFFVTDGRHNADEDWNGPLQQLTSKSGSGDYQAEIVTFGFGDAIEEDLKKIATAFAFISRDTGDLASQAKEIFKAIIGSVKVTSQSARSGEGGYAVPVDQTKFVSLPVHTT